MKSKGAEQKMLMSLPEALAGNYAGAAVLPNYDRSAVTVGIVHLGVGGFQRSHQAMYVDQLLSKGLGQKWGICGVGILERDRQMRDAMAAQDNLYTVLLKSPNGTVRAHVVGAMVEYLFVPDDPREVIEKLAAPTTRIVTMTITEGGYNLEPATKEFNDDDTVIRAELAGDGIPRTHFRLIYKALRLRKDRGIIPFTVVSCDNIQGNGNVARRTLIRYVQLADPAFATWIAKNVRFPNSMVDRITPMTVDADRNLTRDRFGLQDAWPVSCESFTQWVLEDDFPLGRPTVEEVGVQLVPDVVPYEMMKLRLLNASHQVIGYFSFLRGHEYVHKAMNDALIRNVVAGFQAAEVQPTLLPVPGIDLAEYRQTLIERFSNPSIRDTIARQCSETSTTIPNFLLPIVRDQIAAGGEIKRAAATVAAWACYAEEAGGHTIVDRRRESVVARAKNTENRYAFIEDESLFGDLSTNDRFRAEFRKWREAIHDRGIEQVLTELDVSESERL